MKRSTVVRLMWSASTWYGRFQSSSATAESAAARTLAGSEPTIRCSRLDLFQTGITTAPRSAAIMHARNCALAWWAKRSPTPRENFSRVSMDGKSDDNRGRLPHCQADTVAVLLVRKLQFHGDDTEV